MENASRIRIRMGEVEVECEGSEAFIKKEIPTLLEEVSKFQGVRGRHLVDHGGAKQHGKLGSTSDIAAKPKVKKCPELIIAAAAKLALVDGANDFTNTDLLREAKGATAFFKKSYATNFAKTLKRLVKDGQLNEPSKNKFSLPPATRANLEPRLA